MRVAKIFYFLIILSISGFAQPTDLNPAFANVGKKVLPSLKINQIQKDKNGLFWIATGNGIKILKHNNPFYDTIETSSRGKSIQSLEFSSENIFLAYSGGVLIYNIQKRKLIKHLPSSVVGNVRRIRNIDDTIYFFSSKGLFSYYKNQLNEIKYDKSLGVVRDMAKYRNEILAIIYASESSILKLENNQLIKTAYSQLFNPTLSALLTMKVAGDTLILCANISYKVIVGGKLKFSNKYFLIKHSTINMAVWDAAITKNKIFFALGNTNNILDGGIIELNKEDTIFSELHHYTKCLYYDEIEDALWIGTENNGIYIFNNISSSIKTNGYRYGSGAKKNDYFLYENTNVVYNISDSLNNSSLTIKKIGDDIKRKIKTIGDSTYIIEFGKVYIVKDNKIIKVVNPTQVFYYDCFKDGDFLYCFSLYSKTVRYNLKTDSSVVLEGVEDLDPTNIQQSQHNILVHNKEQGFFLYTPSKVIELLYNKSPIYNIDDFSFIENNKVYVLSENQLLIYEINEETYQLKLLSKFKLSDCLKGFIPIWLVKNAKNEVFMVSNNALLKCNNGVFSNFMYLGNRNLTNRPEFDQFNRLIFTEGGYTTILENSLLHKKVDFNILNLEMPESIQEFQPLSLKINTDNYFSQTFSLKKIEIKQKDKVVFETYLVGDELTIPQSLERGEYEVHVVQDGKSIASKKISIKIPLERNPLFYVMILALLMLTFFLFFKVWYNKRIYDKKILSNELELLHKNLNPHFIFNSLNLIYSNILEENKEEALLVLRDFSKLQRNFLERSKETKVTLQSEIEFVKSYLMIERLRYKGDINLVYKEEFDPSIRLDEIFIPPNILQPIIENALKYGVFEYNGDEPKEIILGINMLNNAVQLSVENPKNTLEGSNNKSIGFNLGLSIVKERIRIYNQEMQTSIKLEFNLPTTRFKHGYRIELVVG